MLLISRQATLALQEDTNFWNLAEQGDAMQTVYAWADNVMQRILRGVTRYMHSHAHELGSLMETLEARSAMHD